MNKRSDSVEMEFLLTYGWAILVVLVAIGALVYFGVLDPDKFTPNKCTCYFTSMEYPSQSVTIEGIDYTECMNITSRIDYDKKKIIFDEIRILYMCINNTLVRI